MSLLSMVMFPKYLAYWRAQHPEQNTAKRGSNMGGVHVRGINNPETSNGGYSTPHQNLIQTEVMHTANTNNVDVAEGKAV